MWRVFLTAVDIRNKTIQLKIPNLSKEAIEYLMKNDPEVVLSAEDQNGKYLLIPIKDLEIIGEGREVFKKMRF